MVNQFLKAKHWQLFFLIIGVPIGSYLTMMAILFSTIEEGTPPNPELVLNVFKFFPFILIFFSSLIFSWFWSVAIGLQSEVPINVQMKTTKFKVFSIIPLVCITVFGVFMFITFSKIKPNEFPIEWLSLFIYPLQILSAFGIFYSMYFAAKTLKTVELQREVKFADFAGEFFMFWIFPIGIWILQPRINDMAVKTDVEDNDYDRE